MARVYFDKRLKWWCLDYIDAHGKRHQVKAARTKTLAEAILRKRLDEVAQEKAEGGPILKPKPFSDIATEYLKYSVATKSQSSSRRDKHILRNLVAYFGNKMIADIGIKQIEGYQAERSLQVKPSTVNREMECLKHLFTKAIEWRYTRQNPVKRVKFLKVDRQVVRYLTELELEQLLSFCVSWIRPIVLVALYTGMRKGKIFDLT
jgi:integrase